ncbi:MAG TPA: altronate oxidoreductase, partial [Segetibacter sp.]
KCEEEEGKFYGLLDGIKYPVQDDKAHVYAEKWHNFTDASLVDSVLGDTSLWDTDLTKLPGFAAEVTQKLQVLQNGNVRNTMLELTTKKEPV